MYPSEPFGMPVQSFSFIALLETLVGYRAINQKMKTQMVKKEMLIKKEVLLNRRWLFFQLSNYAKKGNKKKIS